VPDLDDGRIKMENTTNTIFNNFGSFMIIAQLINLLIIGGIVWGIIYFWRKVSKWNNERNQILHGISLELAEIKKEMRKNRGL
jgi:type II secretory pathway component PulF